MADELTLPQLPPAGDNDLFAADSRPYKRVRLYSTSPPISSDPLFSSDDDPSAENYSRPHRRQKRKFRGPWFSQQLETVGQEKTKRTLKRQFDSAVWLGSDGTDMESDVEALTRGPIIPNPASVKQQTIAVRPGMMHVGATRISREDPLPEELAQEQIEHCLEVSKEDVDLSNRGLTRIPNAIIKPLSTFVSIPKMSQGVEFKSLRPALKIFLASNMLRRVPGEFCNLDGISVLSLRNNDLVELPSTIGKLRHLCELNVANNRLRFLPYEILGLLSGPHSKLNSLQLHPNPFYEPRLSHEQMEVVSTAIRPPSQIDAAVDRSGKLTQWEILYRYRSHVRFLDIYGTLAAGPTFPRDESLFSSPVYHSSSIHSSPGGSISNSIPAAPFSDIPKPPRSRGMIGSMARSLLEMAVHSCSSQQFTSGDLEYCLGRDQVPPNLPRLLEDAETLRESEGGDRKCTVCKRVFVIPRTEWIEWYEIVKEQPTRSLASAASPLRQMENKRDTIERLIPLMRRGCTWNCLPNSAAAEELPVEARV